MYTRAHVHRENVVAGKSGSMVFQPLKDGAECSFLSAFNDVWSSTVLEEIGVSVKSSLLLYFLHNRSQIASTHTYRQIHTRVHTSSQTLFKQECTDTIPEHSLSPFLTALARSIFFFPLFFCLVFAKIVCSFNVLPSVRKDLNSPRYTLTRQQDPSFHRAGQHCPS